MKYAVRSFTIVEVPDGDERHYDKVFSDREEALAEALFQCQKEIESAKFYIQDLRSIIGDLEKEAGQ